MPTIQETVDFIRKFKCLSIFEKFVAVQFVRPEYPVKNIATKECRLNEHEEL